MHLLNDAHLGVVTSACSLLIMLAEKNPNEFKSCVNLAASRLSRIVTANYQDFSDYTYYFIPTPWLCVKLLRLLQCFPPTTDHQIKLKINECLEMILNKQGDTLKSRKIQHSNAKNAIFFEAVNLIFHMDAEATLFTRAAMQLGQFLTHKETNFRYMALESLCMLATSEHSRAAVEKHRETVVKSLKSERDISVRKRAVDLLYAICENDNAPQIVSEMLRYLENADFSIREELVLKIAILSERYATDYTWYVDTMLALIKTAGDHVSEEVWHRVIQMIINRDDVQGYAAKVSFEALQMPTAHENMIKVAGYILGEFGNMIAGDSRSTPIIQFNLLHSRFHLCSLQTRCLLLSSYIKFINLFPEIKDTIMKVLQSDIILKSADVELQQRALEYTKLATIVSRETLASVLEEMPQFQVKESNKVLERLIKTKPNCIGVIEKKGGSGRTTPASHVSGGTTSPEKKTGITMNKDKLVNGNAGAADTSNSLIDFLDVSSEPPQQQNSVDQNPPAMQNNADILGGMMNSQSAGNNIFDMPVTATPAAPADPFGLAPTSVTPPQPTNQSPQPWSYQEVELDVKKFVNKHSSVLFENDSMQIGMRGEFTPPNAQISIFFGNKTSLTFKDFDVALEDEFGLFENFRLIDETATDTIDAGKQISKVINCIYNSKNIGEVLIWIK